MRIAIFHNRYRHRGGEDRVVDCEVEWLRKAGHEVHPFVVDNRREIDGSPLGAVRAGLRARFNSGMAERARAFVAERGIEVAHIHNFFPVLTPAVHAALAERGVPVVQTLHNYRLLCANGMFLRDGAVCEDCVARGPWNAVRHGCYRGSRIQTAVWADQTRHHRRSGTWERNVDLFLVPSAFARRKLLAAGLPPDRVRVKPNAVADPGPPPPPGAGAVFVGRLSREKGVHLLLDAWRRLDGAPLVIAGGGPEAETLRRQGGGIPGVRFAGEVGTDRVIELLRGAAFHVLPSIWYENQPVALAEAMACGRASVTSTPSALDDWVDPGRTGLRFERGDAGALADACAQLLAAPERAAAMGREARADYEDRLTPEACVAALEDAYAEAARVREVGRTAAPQ